MVLLFIGVGRRVGYVAMGAGSVPVAVGYIVAHYLTYLLVEGQRVVTAASDPFQQGWDLFGTARFEPTDEWLSSSVVWTVQVIAVVLGHVAGAYLPADTYVRYLRARGDEVRYVCGSDDNGVASLISARKEGRSVEELTAGGKHLDENIRLKPGDTVVVP